MFSKTSADGVHAIEGVEYIARAAGWCGDKLPSLVILPEDMGFSEITAFVKTSDGRGYYKTTSKTCSCPSFKFRGGPCKHQKRLLVFLDRRASKASKLPMGVRGMTLDELEVRRQRIAERNRRRAEERASSPTPSSSRGFNMPGTLAEAL